MKIIQVMPEFALAGAEIMCENLTYELVKAGHDVVVVSMYTIHTPITDRLEAFGVKLEYLDKKTGFDFSVFKKMKKLFKKEKPDVVHTHRYSILYAMPMAILCGVKRRIHTIHSVAQKENGKFARKVNKIFFECFSVTPVALSSVVQATIVDEYKINYAKIPIVLNGVDIDKFSKKSDYHISDKINIMHIGRFHESKNHVGLINAFELVHQKYPEAILNLYGEGPLFHEIKKLVVNKSLSDFVIFHGTIDDIACKFIENDIFCLPSNYEGVPMTLIEAMAVAMPIVATNVGGIPDMLENEKDALLCDVNSDAVAKCLIRLIDSEELRQTLGKNALNRSSEFSSYSMAKKYLDLY